MLYIIIIWALWRLCKRIKRHCSAHPYEIADYQAPDTSYSIADYLPDVSEDEATENPAVDMAKAEIDRLKTLKLEYMAVLDGIESEQADLRTEYKQASVKRKSAISSKLTSLARQHASTTKTLQGIDAKIEKQYYKINA